MMTIPAKVMYISYNRNNVEVFPSNKKLFVVVFLFVVYHVHVHAHHSSISKHCLLLMTKKSKNNTHCNIINDNVWEQ